MDTRKRAMRQEKGLGMEALGEISHLPTHEADVGSQLFDQEMAYVLSSLETQQVQDIEAALLRLQSGNYGVCENCGQPIPLARLEVVPEARYCVDCEEMLQDERGRFAPLPQEVRRVPDTDG